MTFHSTFVIFNANAVKLGHPVKTYKFWQERNKNLQVLTRTQEKTCKFWHEHDKNLQFLARTRQKPLSFGKNATKTCKFRQERDKNLQVLQGCGSGYIESGSRKSLGSGSRSRLSLNPDPDPGPKKLLEANGTNISCKLK